MARTLLKPVSELNRNLGGKIRCPQLSNPQK